MIDLQLKAAILRAARDIRLAEFNLGQELLEHDLTELSDEQLAWCEKQVGYGIKFSYELGMNAFTNERWNREREKEAAERERLEAEVLEKGYV
jgi:hypothetical protein